MANNVFQVKRTNTSGRTPNTTGSYATNSQYIAAGEFALNMADGILYTSNGSAVIEVGANNTNQRITNSLTINNNKNLNFATVNTSAAVNFIQQSDDNFVMYSTNTSYGQRAIWSVFANSNSSEFSFSAPVRFNANVTALTANGTTGTAGQVLASNGSAVYWVSPGAASVNTAAQFTWTNTHIFQANVSFTGNGIGITSNTGAIYLGGLADANWKIARNSGVVTKWIYTNNTIDIVTANSNLEGMSIGLVNGNSYFETGYLGTYIASNVTIGNTSVSSTINSTAFSGTANNATNLGGTAAAGYQTTAGLSSNVATLTANNTSFVGTVSAANVVSNAQLSGNLANYVTTTNLTNNLANYQTTAGLASNVATLTANNTSFVGAVSAANVVSNAQLSGNLANYVTTTNLTNNLANYQTTAGLSANVATLTANNANFVKANNGITSNSFGVFVTQGSGIVVNATGVHVLANSGIIANSTGTFVNGNTGVVVNSTGVFVNATYIGTISANNASFLGGVAAASYQTTAGLAGNVATLTANNTSFVGTVSAANVVSNAQLSGNLANYVTTTNLTNNLANYQTTAGLSANVATLTANNASFLGGVAAASYVNTSGAYTISGIHTYTANLVVNAAIIAGGNSGTAGQVLTSNGAGNVYWSTVSSGSSNAVYMKGGAAAIGTLAEGGTNLFRVNANTLNYNTTFVAGENGSATGPITVASGITLTIESGARVSII